MIAELALAASAACGRAGSVAQADSAYLVWAADTWQRAGRLSLWGAMGVRWAGGGWAVDSNWHGSDDVAASAYFTQPLVESAISLALARCDGALLDELAGFYLTAFVRFQRFGALQAKQAPLTLGWRGDAFRGADSTLTLPWIRAATRWIPAHPAECLLCVAQFLHPAARLIRVLAGLPPTARTNQERQFVQLYTPLIAADQVLRFAYQLPADLALHGGPAHGAVAGWQAQARLPGPRRWRYPENVKDTDLWLLAEAAELVAGHATDSSFVVLRSGESDSLKTFVAAGIARLRRSMVTRTVGSTLSGHAIRATSLFEGDFALYSDFAFAGDTSAAYPTPGDSARVDSVGWDISHATRVPVFFSSLLASRNATGEEFPADSDITGLINQLRFRVFHGAPSRPLLRNFFDGTDGWYRVGYSGRGEWGYPPSQYCDGQSANRPCLGATALPAWGLLAPSDPFLRGIADTLIGLAGSRDPGAVAFRERYYATREDHFTFDTPVGGRPSLLLFQLISNFADPGTMAAGPMPGR